jgi:hypothetical protein
MASFNLPPGCSQTDLDLALAGDAEPECPECECAPCCCHERYIEKIDFEYERLRDQDF